MPELEELQAQLDETDRVLLDTIRQRLLLSGRLAEAKLVGGIEPMKPAEVNEAVERRATPAVGDGLESEFVKRVYRLLVERARRIEIELRHSTEGRAEPSAMARRAVRIDHAAIAVRDLDMAIQAFIDQYGFTLAERRRMQGERTGMELAVMEAGDVTLVLVMGTDPQSNVSRYIEHYGPGVQHLAIQVESIEAVHTDLRGRDANLLTGIIRAADIRQAFTRRDANTGMQFEFLERSNINEFEEDNIKELYDAMDREDVY